MSRAPARRAVVALGLLAGTLLLVPSASAEIQEGPAEGQALTGHAAVTVTATFQGASTLQVSGPAGVVAEDTDAVVVGEGTLSVVLNTACPAEPADGCAPTAPAPNGEWLISQTGSTEDSRPFRLAIGGVAPTEVTAALTDRTVRLSWRPGPEPDLTGFVVSDGSITLAVPKDACAEGVCTATFEYPAPASGERSFSVRALRPSGIEDTPDVAGAPASSEPVALPAPPPGDPTAGPTADATNEPTATPGTPGGPGASASPGAVGGDGRATAQSFAQGFSSFAPSLGLPKLPPLPATTAPQVAGPQVADTFDPTLSYGEQQEQDEPGLPEPVAAPSGRETVLQSTGGLLGDEQLLRSIAGALVLMLAAGHLRSWLSRSRPDDLA